MASKFIDVVDALGMDSERLWYYIPGFNGYEISNDGYVRSMKHWKSHPTGMLIRPVSKDGSTFELSNDYNQRIRITLKELWKLSQENPYIHPGYPRKTYQLDMASRNIRAFIPPKPRVIETETLSMPSFTVIPDMVVEPKKEIICPIMDLLGREICYGRQEENRGYF